MKDSRQRGAPVRSAAADAASPARNLAESPLAWLARRKDKDGRPMLAAEEFDAGEKLRCDFWFAGMTPRVTANWSLLLSTPGGAARGHDCDLKDGAIAARERVRRALSAVGPELACILIDVCCHLKGLEASEKASGWPQRSGKIILQIALRQLARHYGMLRLVPDPHRTPVQVRHWGTSDYRARIEPDAG